MKLWLVRHAAPTAGTGRCYGHTDLPAEPAATSEAARRVAAVLPPGAAIRSSPLARCHALALALRQLRHDLPLTVDARLAEMHFGAWEGQAWEQLGATALDAWTRDFWHHRPDGGESLQQVFTRVGAAFDEARERGVDEAWVTHAGVIRTVQLLAGGRRRIDDAADWPRTPVPFGAWQVVET